jgi:hypothetical protein
VLGYIGGIYAIIWAFFGFTVENYNSFSKGISLISNFYTTETEDEKMLKVFGRVESQVMLN